MDNGVNIIAYFSYACGITRSAILTKEALQHKSINYKEISYGHPVEQRNPLKKENILQFGTNLICLDQIGTFNFLKEINNKNFRNIYFWFWETDYIPRDRRKCLSYLDEVWVSSQYIKENLENITNIPVRIIPQPVQLPPCSLDASKQSFGLADRFTFLFSFSFASSIDRKNPQAIIHAFKKAFDKTLPVQLIIKSQDSDLHSKDRETIKNLIGYYKDPRIIWIDDSFDMQKQINLMNVCDCYISLHRSEGFGLTMAEAMLLGKPVIGTAYSGNLDFMNANNSFLCSYKLVPVRSTGQQIYTRGTWAEPDIDHAAELMRKVFNEQKETLEVAKRGQMTIRQMHSFENSSEKMAELLKHKPLKKKWW